MIVAVTAAATAASILLYIGSIADALSHNDVLQNKVERILAQTNGGEPQNILILGSDKRASEPEDPGRSDTTILLRLDPDQQRDRADVDPARPQGRNPRRTAPKSSTPPTPTAGPKLTLQVVKELTGLPINHIVNVDFLGFVRAVYAIGCVYVDVDRRYYHSNVGVRALRTVLGNQRPARLPADVRQEGAASTCATATPTPTSSAPPASRTSSAPPASGSRSRTWCSAATN